MRLELVRDTASAWAVGVGHEDERSTPETLVSGSCACMLIKIRCTRKGKEATWPNDVQGSLVQVSSRR